MHENSLFAFLRHFICSNEDSHHAERYMPTRAIAFLSIDLYWTRCLPPSIFTQGPKKTWKQPGRATEPTRHSCLQRISAKVVPDFVFLVFLLKNGSDMQERGHTTLPAPWKPSEPSARNCRRYGRDDILCLASRDRSVSLLNCCEKEVSSSSGCHPLAVLGTSFTAKHVLSCKAVKNIRRQASGL